MIQLGDDGDLPRQLKNGTVPFAGIKSGMRCDTLHSQRVFTNAFTRGFYRSAQSGGGLEHQHAADSSAKLR